MIYNRRSILALTGASIGCTLLPSGILAADRGLQIAQDRYNRDRGWGDSVAAAKMTLNVPGSGQSVREMSVKTMETKGDGDMALTEFDRPRDLQGTLFLSHSHAKQADDQWLYLPSGGQVRRIASRNKSGSFLGSEFTYEDLSSFNVGKYSYQYLRDENQSGMQAHVIRQIPVYKYTGYSAMDVWLDTSHLRPLKVAFFDRGGQHFKTLTFSGYKQYAGRFWRAHTARMQNHTNGRDTVMKFSNISFGVGLNASEFSPSRLG